MVLDTLVGTPKDEAQLEACFGSLGDCVNLDSR
jgi:hypothetical protein